MKTPYIQIWSDDISIFAGKLTKEEFADCLIAVGELGSLGFTKFKPKTDVQAEFWERLSGAFEKSKKQYKQKKNSGKIGGQKSAEKHKNAKSQTEAPLEAPLERNSSYTEAEAETETDITTTAKAIADTGSLAVAVSTNVDTGAVVAPQLTASAVKTRRIIPPPIEAVAAYCASRGNSVSAEHFCDYYASKNWKIRGDPMRDWQAAVRTWEHRDKRSVSPPQKRGWNGEDLV